MKLPQSLVELLVDNPDVALRPLIPNPAQILNSLIEALNFAVSIEKDPTKLNKMFDSYLLHAFENVDMEILKQCFDYLAFTNIERLNRKAFAKLLARVPQDMSCYKRIKGNMLFELCRHMPYVDAVKLLEVKDV